MSQENENNNYLICENNYFQIFQKNISAPMIWENPLEYTIKTKDGKTICTDALHCDIYDSEILVMHKDNKLSVFNSEGKPLKGCYRQEKLDPDVYYTYTQHELEEEEAVDHLATLKKFLSHVFMGGVWLTAFYGMTQLPGCVEKRSKEIAEMKKKQSELMMLENKQKATFIKLSGRIAQFDVNGDNKPDYAVLNLTTPDITFLNKNTGQTKTIGSWKGCLNNRAIWMEYTRSQHQKQ